MPRPQRLASRVCGDQCTRCPPLLCYSRLPRAHTLGEFPLTPAEFLTSLPDTVSYRHGIAPSKNDSIKIEIAYHFLYATYNILCNIPLTFNTVYSIILALDNRMLSD